MIDYEEIQRIKAKYYDPSNPTSKTLWDLYRNPANKMTFAQGKVVDNRDPKKLGRVKVIAPIAWGGR